MTVSIIIPARLESTRLPKKVLLDETGCPLIWYSIENAIQSNADHVIVATDSHEIIDKVIEYARSRIATGIREGRLCVIQTPKMNSGTERVAWTAATLRNVGVTIGVHDQYQMKIENDIIINLQADEPELKSEYINKLIESIEPIEENSMMVDWPWPDIVTLASFSEESVDDPNSVKVVVDNKWNAMYFSRSVIPYGGKSLIHTGIYGFNYNTLLELNTKRDTTTQSLKSESLEQLEWLQNGYKIRIIPVDQRAAGIDTKEDYQAFVKRIESQK